MLLLKTYVLRGEEEGRGGEGYARKNKSQRDISYCSSSEDRDRDGQVTLLGILVLLAT